MIYLILLKISEILSVLGKSATLLRLDFVIGVIFKIGGVSRRDF